MRQKDLIRPMKYTLSLPQAIWVIFYCFAYFHVFRGHFWPMLGHLPLNQILLGLVSFERFWIDFKYDFSFWFYTKKSLVTLTGFLSFLAFIDPILTFIQILIVNGGSASAGSNFIYGIRMILALIFPNIAVKRGMYNMKIRSNDYCIKQVNLFLESK